MVCIKGKNGKRWNLGNIKWQFFFKVQVTDETRAKNRWKKIDLPFSCAILSEGKKEEKNKWKEVNVLGEGWYG